MWKARSRMVSASVLLAALAAGGASVSAQPAPGGWGMHGGGMHGGRDGDGAGMMFGGSPERMGRMIDRMLDGIGATDAQRSQIKQIAAAAAADLRANGGASRDLRQRSMQIFTAPTVDAAAAEQLRQQMSQQQDRASRRVTQAMVDIARVLTPEQRARIGERMKDRQARMDERMKRMQGRMPPGPGGPGAPAGPGPGGPGGAAGPGASGEAPRR